MSFYPGHIQTIFCSQTTWRIPQGKMNWWSVHLRREGSWISSWISYMSLNCSGTFELGMNRHGCLLSGPGDHHLRQSLVRLLPLNIVNPEGETQSFRPSWLTSSPNPAGSVSTVSRNGAVLTLVRPPAWLEDTQNPEWNLLSWRCLPDSWSAGCP